MALGENLEEVVNILTRYYSGQLDLLRDMYGDQAPMLANEMGDMLSEIIQSETPFSQLWLEYIDQPVENEAELIGALEMLEESIPVISVRLEGYYAGFLTIQNQDTDLIENPELEDEVVLEELASIKSIDDGDDDDEYREESTYLVGNVEDHSTSAMYYEDLDSSVEPNESEDG